MVNSRDAGAMLCKDSLQLEKTLENLQLASQKMCSTDVGSLLTNIPLHETSDFLYDFILQIFILPYRLTSSGNSLFCAHTVSFYPEGISYRWTDGVAADSLFGPALTEVFLFMFKSWMHSNSFQTLLCRRFVDDILVFTNSSHFTILRDFRSVFLGGRNEQYSKFLSNQTHGEFRQNDPAVYQQKSDMKRPMLNFVPITHKRGLMKTFNYRTRNVCPFDTRWRQKERFFGRYWDDHFLKRLTVIHSRNRPGEVGLR